MFGCFLASLLVGATKAYSGGGAGIVVESTTSVSKGTGNRGMENIQPQGRTAEGYHRPL